MSDRRRFIKKAGIASLATIAAGEVVFGKSLPEGLELIGLAQDQDLPSGVNPEMSLLNDLPWNIEAKAHLLDDAITPADKFFIRNNGIPPENPDPKTWELTIEGESAVNSKIYTIDDLKSQFKTYSYQLVVECGGNGRHRCPAPAGARARTPCASP